ncbi:MAG: hypothetical protein LBK53_06990 [Heliobacteriaceae bacterium]|jgi:hypothetical protein|nr:hypothetical protein [Heliobacteriaceae bacterium]
MATYDYFSNYQYLLPAFDYSFSNFNLNLQAQLNQMLQNGYKNNLTSGYSRPVKTNNTAGKNNSYGVYSREFLEKTKSVANNINCNYKDLIAVFNGESALKTNAANGKTAVGLIQFTTPAITELNRKYGLNLTKQKILAMSADKQLDLVEKYYTIVKKQRNIKGELSGGQLYAMTYLPARAKQEVLARAGEGNDYYEANIGLDLNKDGKITQAELDQRVKRKHVDEALFA